MSESDKPIDPLEAWRAVRNASLDAWAKVMTQTVGTDEYAKATGATMDAYLTASIPVREMVEKAMAQTLQQVNMPTREDFISLAGRLTNIELQLDDLDAKLDEIAKRQAAAPAAGVAAPPVPSAKAKMPPAGTRTKRAK